MLYPRNVKINASVTCISECIIKKMFRKTRDLFGISSENCRDRRIKIDDKFNIAVFFYTVRSVYYPVSQLSDTVFHILRF